MTRPRSTYRYEPQSVASPSGAFLLEHAGEDERTLALLRDGTACWSLSLGRRSPKQIFVSDDGRSAVLDAADVLTFRAPDGHPVGELPLIAVAQGGDERQHPVGAPGSPVMLSSAGPIWDDYLAGTFLPFDDAILFVVSGRGVPPLVIDPSTAARVSWNPELVRGALRSRASRVLREASNALAGRARRATCHDDPWRLAAVGWARVAGETDAQDAVPHLEALANLDMVVAATTWIGGYPRPSDPIRVDRYELDPVRQASHLALLRMGHAAPSRAVMRLARREGWFRTSWLELPLPPGRAAALPQISVGVMPSELIARVGPPTHVAAPGSRLTWSYDDLGPEGPRTVEIRWGRRGAEHVSHGAPIPPAAPDGRVA